MIFDFEEEEFVPTSGEENIKKYHESLKEAKAKNMELLLKLANRGKVKLIKRPVIDIENKSDKILIEYLKCYWAEMYFEDIEKKLKVPAKEKVKEMMGTLCIAYPAGCELDQKEALDIMRQNFLNSLI